MSQTVDRAGEAATSEIQKLNDEVDQLRVQLAGCGVAALGGTSDPVVARRGQYGWSQAYQDVLNLRIKLEAVLAELDETKRALRVEQAMTSLRVALSDYHAAVEVDEQDTEAMERLLERLRGFSDLADMRRRRAETTTKLAMEGELPEQSGRAPVDKAVPLETPPIASRPEVGTTLAKDPEPPEPPTGTSAALAESVRRATGNLPVPGNPE